MDTSRLKSLYSEGSRRGGSLLVVLVLMAAAFFPVKRAWACSLCDPVFNVMQVQIINAYAEIKHEQTRRNVNRHTDEDFEEQRQWDLHVYFNEYWGKAMALMAEQLSAVALNQMQILGSFLDAKHQMETQRLFGQLAAQAHKDYQPSEGLCSMGTTYRNLGYAEGNANLTSWILSRRSMARQVQNNNGVATEGRVTDTQSRVAQYLKTYCDPNDNAGNLRGLCDNGVTRDRKNRDIDYPRLLGVPMSLNATFSDGGDPTNDEADLLAMQANIFANSITKTAVASSKMNQDAARKTDTEDPSLQAYLSTRAVIAMRAVAQSSFNDLAGMKTSGTNTANNAQYIQAAIKQLNPEMSNDDAKAIAGDNPSYDAQMEILTQKLLQDSQFYTDLYDKPANVARKGVALQAIANIQERDNYKSTLRSEMLWSQLLELKLIDAQSQLQNRVTNVKQ